VLFRTDWGGAAAGPLYLYRYSRRLPVAQAVTVTIGGVTVPAAQVVYSGAAPGSVEGLTQIDAYVPQSVTPGPAVPVVVTIGGVASPAGITLSVN